MTQDLFAADSYGFTNAFRWLMILTGSCIALGIIYTVIVYFKKKNAIAPIPGKTFNQMSITFI